MAIEITVPRLGWTMEEGTFLGWLKKDGDTVRTGEALYTLEGDKAAQEIEATESGILRISPQAPAMGGTVRVGALLGFLAAEGDSVAFAREPGRAPSDPVNVPTNGPVAPTPVPARPDFLALSGAITISPRAARTAAALGVDWMKIRGTGRTGRIRERDVLAAASRL